MIEENDNHPSFSPPRDTTTLWRYMNMTKFLSLLETERLYFCRADQFRDPFEGVTSRATVRALREQATREKWPEGAEPLLRALMDARKRMFISCWFASEYESAAMWSLYCNSDEGIAIRTNHCALAAELERSPLKFNTSTVRYVDYDEAIIPPGNLFFPFVYKRMSFAHENEVRAILWSGSDANKEKVAPDATGIDVDISPANLIHSIHVSPQAPVWLGQLVEQLATRYGLNVPVVRSGLYDRPTY